MSASNHASEFTGSARYKVLRRLGAGAFGVVYEAEDTLLGGSVALKVLHRPDGNTLYRFKNEFRALADLKHDNLVALHELTKEGDRWFFTMELVDGVDVVKFLWGDAAALMRDPNATDSGPRQARPSQLDTQESARSRSRGASPTAATPEETPAVTLGALPFDVERLRAVFAQLARGVAALHDAGKVHRDIKPSNVLVEASGRVVILDFGLVTEFADEDVTTDVVVGTPAYMAPEQAMGELVGPACDWYSVGCVLYLALTGRLPVQGKTPIEVLTRKQMEDPPPPRELRAAVPPDLDELCMALLAREPGKRPSGSEVLRRLGARAPSIAPPGAMPSVVTDAFVGRDAELDTLARAYRSMRDGRAVVVTVRGRSGFGKTALVRRFIEQAERADAEVVALAGRCYERESVPYKALDALVDGLRRWMRRLPEAERSAILPRNFSALARLFPVFKGVADAEPRRLDQLRDTLEMRRRGFSALRELFARAADRQRVILFIDDLQWGDFDSAAALAEILAPPDPPPLLLVLGYRSEDVARSELLLGLSNLARPMKDSKGNGAHIERFDVELGPLADDEARALVERLVAEAPLPGGLDPARAEQIVREGAGMPFMLGELVAFMQQAGGAAAPAAGAPGGGSSLVDALVRARAALLADDARALLEIVCVAGQPLSFVSACRAAKLEGERAQSSLDALRVGKLIRARGDHVETFHDRVGEAVCAGLAPDALASRHGALAEALEREPGCDPERLGMHLRASGAASRARAYIERAASHASATLAFERAVRLYRAALEIADDGAADTHELRAKLAEALANAGQGGEAGRAYLAAIAGASPEQVLDLRRRAAEQFLRSGHIDEALPVVDAVLAEVGLAIPATPGLSLASLLVQRAKLWMRGLEFEERKAVPPAELRKIDVCWALGNGMGGVDVIRGADFQARHLWLALRAGEPYRISRALAWEAVLSAIEGGRSGLGRAADIAPRAMAIAKRIDDHHALAWANAAEAIRQFCLGNWTSAGATSEIAIALFQEHCADIGWEVGSMEMWWWLPSLRWRGDYAVLARRAGACAKEASARGDLYTVVGVRTHVLPHVHLVGDRPDDASRESTEAIREWSQKRWLTHHWCDALVQAHAALYAGRLGDALAGLERDVREMQRALQMRLQTMRIQLLDVRARASVAAALEGGAQKKALLSAAERDAALLEKEDLPWASALASVARAAAAKARGDDALARELYARADKAFTGLDMAGHALAARLQRVTIEGGDGASAAIAEVTAGLAARGVASPERFARMLVP